MVQTNCFAYILTAYNAKTGLLHGYYKGGIAFPEITGSIWYAKFVAVLKTAKNWKELLEKKSNHADNGDELIWKIQKVSMNAPEDVE